MTLVWLSPALPADRTELAASLPPDLALFSLPSLDDPAAIDGLAVGSLCVATVFEGELLEKLATRPEGVRLLVVGPPDYPGQLPTPTVGRPPDAMTPASSMSELAAAISQAAMGSAPTAGMAVVAAPARARMRSRLAAAGAVLAGLAIGGIVIGVTEGSSSASAQGALNNNGPQGGSNGGQFQGPGGGNFGAPGGGTFNGPNGTGQNGTAPNGTGGRFDRDGIEQQLLTCLRSKGFTGTADQLRVRQADPKLRQAFAACIQQLSNGSSQLPGRP